MTSARPRRAGLAASLAGLATLAFFSFGAPGAALAAAAQPVLPGASAKDPVSIDADKLVYYDKEQKAVYSGNVVVVQGETKLTCAAMTVFLDRTPAPGAPAEPASTASEAENGPSSGAGIRRLEAAGPVTVVSKSQVATGDTGSYDKNEGKVLLIGHVTLSDGQNVTKGEKLVYDLKTGQATVENGPRAGRVHGLFVPGDTGKAK
jgi:lipopolysaccharide export system protein LptA